MDVRSAHCALEKRPVSFKCIGMVNAANIFLLVVIDGPVNIAVLGKFAIAEPFVSADRRTMRDILLYLFL
jgi:hypothetical protein